MPVEGAAKAQSGLVILDPERLVRRTMGSEALRVEILALFVAELERLLRQVEQAADGQIRSDRLAAIRELARTVGAARLDEAARIAAIDADLDEPDFAPLRHAVWEVVETIRNGLP